MTLFYDNLSTPIGVMEITASATAVKSIYFVEKARPANGNEISEAAKHQLQEYFAGHRKQFDLPLGAEGTESVSYTHLTLPTILLV